MRSLLLLSLVFAVPSAAFAVQPTIAVGSAIGVPGEELLIAVTLDIGDQQFVLGIDHRIFWDADHISVRRLENGQPDCVGDAALPPNFAAFICLNSIDGRPCVGLRAIINAQFNEGSLQTGPLYTCLFVIGPAAPAGSYELDNTAAIWRDGLGHINPARPVLGLITVIQPTPTSTPTETPTETATATASATATITPTASVTGTATGTATRTRTPGTPSRTPTITRTRTITQTPTVTRTPTQTPTPAIAFAVIGDIARPGDDGDIAVNFTDRTSRAAEVGFDLLLEERVFDLVDISNRCSLDERLTHHELSATVFPDPPPPPGKSRVRFGIFDPAAPADLVRSGPLVHCAVPLEPDAPAGSSPLLIDRKFAGDADGRLLTGVLGIDDIFVVDPGAPTHTRTPTAGRTATVTRTPSLLPRSRTPTQTGRSTAPPTGQPSASPTAQRSPSATTSATRTVVFTATPMSTPPPCPGDCDGDGHAAVNELIQSVNIALASERAATCGITDMNRDEAITIDELIAAVRNALQGCPQ